MWLALLVALATLVAAPAHAAEYTYNLTLEAAATGDNFIPRDPAVEQVTGSLRANWTGNWDIYFTVDRQARTAAAATLNSGAKTQLVNSLSETTSGPNGELTCAFADVEVEPVFTLNVNKGSSTPTSATYESGAVHFDIQSSTIGFFGTERFPCSGTPADYATAPNEHTVPGLFSACRASFQVPIERVGDDLIVVESDSGPLPGCYDHITAGSYTAHVKQTATLVREGAPPSDLVIRKLSGSGEIKQVDGQPMRVWRVRAEVANTGRGASPAADVLLEGARVEESTRTPRFEPLVTAPLPALKPGESTTVEWVAGEHGWNEVDLAAFADSNLLRATVDPDNAVTEESKKNNKRRLWRIGCDAVPVEQVWVEAAEEGDRTRLSPPDYGAALDSLPVGTIEEKSLAILCFIQLEAQQRAKSLAESIRGSKFELKLANHFLRKYLKRPSRKRGRKAMDMIGEGSRFAYLPIPKGFRKVYKDLPKRIYAAVDFLAGRKNHHHIPYIDGPYLIGKPNRRRGLDDDWGPGGRNQTNVMHWATGVRYGELGEDAFRTMFIGYELFHLEGWDVFGEDSLNDLIGEEAGRLLGRRLLAGSIKNHAGLIRALDADFREARAWVGAMLRLRRQQLDDLILAQRQPRARFWWRTNKVMAPWGQSTIYERFENDDSLTAVRASDPVERLVQIYTLVYEAEEWQRANGSPLTPLVRDIVEGAYDDQFKALPREDFSDEWDIEIRPK